MAGSVTSALVVGSSAAVSSILVYLAWTSLVSWHVFQDDGTSATGVGGSTIGCDPLVWALMSVAGVAVCETSVLVSWLWRPSRNARGRRPGVGSFLRWASFHLTVFGLAFQLAATFYLLLMDVKFPGLHQIHPASGITISTQKRPITRILHDEHPHQVALEEAMKIYRLYKPTLVCTFVISILIKAIWLKRYHHKKTTTDYRCKRRGDGTRTDLKPSESDLVRSRVELDSLVEDFYSQEEEPSNICRCTSDIDDLSSSPTKAIENGVEVVDKGQPYLDEDHQAPPPSYYVSNDIVTKEETRG